MILSNLYEQWYSICTRKHKLSNVIIRYSELNFIFPRIENCCTNREFNSITNEENCSTIERTLKTFGEKRTSKCLTSNSIRFQQCPFFFSRFISFLHGWTYRCLDTGLGKIRACFRLCAINSRKFSVEQMARGLWIITISWTTPGTFITWERAVVSGKFSNLLSLSVGMWNMKERKCK